MEAPACLCEKCGCATTAKVVLFRQNISYLYERRETVFCGRACLRCMTTMFWKFTLTTMLLTWFGVMGMILGPLYIVINCTEYLSALVGLALQRGHPAART